MDSVKYSTFKIIWYYVSFLKHGKTVHIFKWQTHVPPPTQQHYLIYVLAHTPLSGSYHTGQFKQRQMKNYYYLNCKLKGYWVVLRWLNLQSFTGHILLWYPHPQVRHCEAMVPAFNYQGWYLCRTNLTHEATEKAQWSIINRAMTADCYIGIQSRWSSWGWLRAEDLRKTSWRRSIESKYL